MTGHEATIPAGPLEIRQAPVRARDDRPRHPRARRSPGTRRTPSSPPSSSSTLLGSVSLLLAANGIDDVYDQLNGVDATADRLFPKEFPGWKPITRGVISVRDGFVISGLFYALSVAIGLYLSVVVGWLAIGIALPGILLSYFYTAPPLKLDYRGLGSGSCRYC